MSKKVMAVFGRPNGCSECACLGIAVQHNGPVKRYCRLLGYTESKGKVTYDETIPDWCPLLPAPDYISKIHSDSNKKLCPDCNGEKFAYVNLLDAPGEKRLTCGTCIGKGYVVIKK